MAVRLPPVPTLPKGRRPIGPTFDPTPPVAGGVVQPPQPIATPEQLRQYIGSLGTAPYRPPPQGIDPSLLTPTTQAQRNIAAAQLAAGYDPTRGPATPQQLAQISAGLDARNLYGGTVPVGTTPPIPAFPQAPQLPPAPPAPPSTGGPPFPDFGPSAAGQPGPVVRASRAGVSGEDVLLPIGQTRFFYNADAGRLWAIDPQGRLFVPTVDQLRLDAQGRALVTVGGITFEAQRDLREGEFLNQEGDPIDLSRLPEGYQVQYDERGRLVTGPGGTVPQGYSANELQQLVNAQLGLGPGRQGRLPVPEMPEPQLPDVPQAQRFGQEGDGFTRGTLSSRGTPGFGTGGEIAERRYQQQLDVFDDDLAQLDARIAVARTPEAKAQLQSQKVLLQRQRDRAEALLKTAKGDTTAERTRRSEQEKATRAAQAEAQKQAEKVAKEQARAEQERTEVERAAVGRATAEQFTAQEADLKRKADAIKDFNITPDLQAEFGLSNKPTPQELAQVQAEIALAQRDLTRTVNVINQGIKDIGKAPAVAADSQSAFGRWYIDPSDGAIMELQPDGGYSAVDDLPLFYDAQTGVFLVKAAPGNGLRGGWYPAPVGAPPEPPLQSVGGAAAGSPTLDQSIQAAMAAGDRETAELLIRAKRNPVRVPLP